MSKQSSLFLTFLLRLREACATAIALAHAVSRLRHSFSDGARSKAGAGRQLNRIPGYSI